jgi:hypothetical protein
MIDAYVTGWNEGKFDTFDTILTTDFMRRAPADMNAHGMEGIKNEMTDLRTSYPEMTEKTDFPVRRSGAESQHGDRTRP